MGIEVVNDTKPAAAKTAVALRGPSSSIPPTRRPKTPQFTMESLCLENPHQEQIREMRLRMITGGKPPQL